MPSMWVIKDWSYQRGGVAGQRNSEIELLSYWGFE